MKIDRLTLQNFRKFENLTLDLHPQFTLLVGGNGSGKTTILDALAVSLSAWLVDLPQIRTSNIEPKDVRMRLVKISDRIQVRHQGAVRVAATGRFGDENRFESVHTLNTRFQPNTFYTGGKILELYNDDPPSNLPVIAFYGVMRAAHVARVAHYERQKDTLVMPLSPDHRLDAYEHCFSEKTDYYDLRKWFYRETAWAGANGGHKRPGYEVIRRAVFGCLPDADDLWFDVDQADLVCSIGGEAQPLGNLSQGQRMLLAMVADIAIKAVTLNAHLLPSDELGKEDEPVPRVLRQTSGVVLIDELDLHLHPSWQRRVAADLTRTFPAIQFVCATHSPQIIGEVPKEQIRIIDGDIVYSPDHSFGVDSSRILEEIMDTKPRTESVDTLLTKLARQISDDDFEGARATIQEAESNLGDNDPEITRARTLMAFVEQRA